MIREYDHRVSASVFFIGLIDFTLHYMSIVTAMAHRCQIIII